MLTQDFLLFCALGTALALGVAFLRLGLGRPVERVAGEVLLAWRLASAAFALAGLALAFAPAATIAGGLGMLDIDGHARMIEQVGLLRALGGTAGGLILLAAIFVVTRQRVEAWLARLAGPVKALVEHWRREAWLLTSTPAGRRTLGVLALIMFVGTWARVGIATQPMSYDESITYGLFAFRSPLDILTDYPIPNNHMFHTLLVHAATRVFGVQELVVRLPALLAGIAIIPVTGWLAWRLFGSGTGLLASALAAGAPALIEYSGRARGYALITLFTLLAFIAVSYALESKLQAAWGLYALCLALALFTVPTALLALYLLSAWALCASWRERRGLSAFVVASAAAGGLALLFYLPLVASSGVGGVLSSPVLRRMGPYHLAHAALAELSTLANCWMGALPVALRVLVLAAFVLGVFGARKRGWPGARLLASLAAAGALVLILHRVVPPTRSLLLVLPMAACLVAAGLRSVLGSVTWREAALLPITALLISCGWVGAHRAVLRERVAATASSGVLDPGAEGILCCGEGYFSDAEEVALWTAREASADLPLFVNHSSGLTHATAFYMLRQGAPLSLVIPFDPERGLEQMDGYDEILVLLRKRPQADPDLESLAAYLELPEPKLASSFEPPEVAVRFSTSVIVRLRARAGSSEARRARGVPRREYPQLKRRN